MKYVPYTYNGNAINDGTNYVSTFLAGVPLLPQTDPILVERSENWPVFAGKNLPGHEITLEVNIRAAAGGIAASREVLKGWFATDDQSLRKLILRDADDSNKQWYLMVTPTDFVPDNRRVIISLSVPDPYWRSETLNSDPWTITASEQTRAITAAGNARSRPSFEITPNNAKTGGYGYKRVVLVRNQVGRALVNYPVELTGGWNTATEVTDSRMQADGDDLRVSIDGVETARALAGINTASTKVWVTADWSIPITLTLSGAMGTGAVTTINFRRTTANKNALKKLPARFNLQIDNEVFLCSAAIPSQWKAAVEGRAAWGTSAASHADAVTCHWLEHEIWVYYGNSTVSTPDIDTSKLPILDTTNSSNTSWVYTDFADEDGLRAGAWRAALNTTLSSQSSDASTYRATSDVYTATQNTEADPASVAGCRIAAWQKGGLWKADTASVEWRLFHPCGVTTVASASGSKFRLVSSWPTTAALQKSNNGSTWASVSAQGSPSTLNNWEAWSIGSTALGATYNYLRLLFSGTVAASAGNYSALEMNAITLTLDNTKTPSVTFGAQQNNYDLDAILENTTTGQGLVLRYLMGTGQTLTIDCEEKTALHSSGANARAALDTDTNRLAWLELAPGSNTLKFTDAGTTNVTIITRWRDRNS